MLFCNLFWCLGVESRFSIFVGDCGGTVGCFRIIKASSGGGGSESIWCVMHCYDVWVLFRPTPFWGRGGWCFVVGVRREKSVVWWSGFGT